MGCVDEHVDISIKWFIPCDDVRVWKCYVGAAIVVDEIPSSDSGRLCRPSKRSKHFRGHAINLLVSLCKNLLCLFPFFSEAWSHFWPYKGICQKSIMHMDAGCG